MLVGKMYLITYCHNRQKYSSIYLNLKIKIYRTIILLFFFSFLFCG